MLVTVSWIEKNYKEFNKKFFDNELPLVKFNVNNSRDRWGYASYRYGYNKVTPESITMSNYYDSPEIVKQQTLIHEMIHILDYFKNPSHFVINGRKVSKRSYDAHGSWFMSQANRIAELSNRKYVISPKVTAEEHNASSYSANTKKNIKANVDAALLCVVSGKTTSWRFKTNKYVVDKFMNSMLTINWINALGENPEMIKFYTFKSESLATARSCASRITGFKNSVKEQKDYLKFIKAKAINDYSDKEEDFMKRMRA